MKDGSSKVRAAARGALIHFRSVCPQRSTRLIGAMSKSTKELFEQQVVDLYADPEQHAFYYARAIEIPTPRWSTYDAVRHDLPLLEDVPATIQERAWTSPIWYSP